MSDDNPIKRWTAKRKAAVVMGVFKGKTTAAEVARLYYLTVSEIEGWIDEAQRSMENEFGARPEGVRDQYESDQGRDTKSRSSSTLNWITIVSATTAQLG
tara:strand:- start:785 stop:1084 length:300 start_codon:yes stop_codon:yes gene_type:complete